MFQVWKPFTVPIRYIADGFIGEFWEEMNGDDECVKVLMEFITKLCAKVRNLRNWAYRFPDTNQWIYVLITRKIIIIINK